MIHFYHTLPTYICQWTVLAPSAEGLWPTQCCLQPPVFLHVFCGVFRCATSRGRNMAMETRVRCWEEEDQAYKPLGNVCKTSVILDTISRPTQYSTYSGLKRTSVPVRGSASLVRPHLKPVHASYSHERQRYALFLLFVTSTLADQRKHMVH